MSAQGYFITGTDTDVGKTCATIALMRYFKRQGKTVLGMKPVASGCTLHAGELKNADALLIQENASIVLDYQLINPYAYQLPVSPHIAGVDNPVKLETIVERYNSLKALADIVIVEGAGGWYAPLNAQDGISDLANTLALPVILVVGLRLGCINHAKLSYQAIPLSGLVCAGWIAVSVDPDLLYRDENIQAITDALPVPLIGVLPYQKQLDYDLLADQLKRLPT